MKKEKNNDELGQQLIKFVKQNNKEEVRRLISEGASLKVTDAGTGRTALNMAIYTLNDNMVELLLDSGADPDLKDTNERDAYETMMNFQIEFLRQSGRRKMENTMRFMEQENQNMLRSLFSSDIPQLDHQGFSNIPGNVKIANAQIFLDNKVDIIMDLLKERKISAIGQSKKPPVNNGKGNNTGNRPDKSRSPDSNKNHKGKGI